MSYIYAMGDIHRYYGKQLRENNLENKDNKLILCSDYIDYGPDSCKVLYRIKELMEIYPKQVVALKGNHETMFLEFLEVKENNVWNIKWIGGDKDFSTINTFILEENKDKIEIIESEHNNPMELGFRIAKLIKEVRDENYKKHEEYFKDV